MGEPKRERPEEQKPLTADDVASLIEAHGGTEGLDLSGRNLRQAMLGGMCLRQANLSKADLRGADLIKADLQGASLAYANLQGARFFHANLERANLSGANLSGANLWEAVLEGAHLPYANLQGANLSGAILEGADLRWANLQGADLAVAQLHGADLADADLRRSRLAHAALRDTHLEDANWGDYVLGDETDGHFGGAASAYRALKRWHTEAGIYDIAGEFHYREMEARRKLAQKEVRIPDVLSLNLFRLLFGYGERPQRVIGWAAAVVFGLALVHWLFGTVAGGFLDALYYSAVSFTALGYGASASFPQGWAGRFLGPAESLMGVFMMALFLVTFTRKMTR